MPHHSRALLLAALPLILLPACAAKQSRVPQSHSNAPSRLNDPALRDDPRMEWWREARFGMFIHWGLYSVPAGEWNGNTGYGEWIRTTAEIPLETYDTFADQFNPVKFDADAIVLAAKQAGMKYIVITSKHHDGFALFDSKVSDFDIMSTPYKRDLLKELARACRRHGITLCFYHSIMDWHHPDYLPRRTWEIDRPAAGADFDRYNAYMNAQVTELLTNYGDIGVMWFDGEWESTWTHERGVALYNLCRSLQPDVIVNNRVDVHRGGMAGFSAEGSGAVGDFGTPEQEVPAHGLPGTDWETCMTIHTHWGHNKADTNAKPGRMLVHTLIDVASKGGNFLLNIGPMSSGEIQPTEADRLAHIGRWMKINSESIHGTGAGVLPSTPWGRSTIKRDGRHTTLYLHAFDWPSDNSLFIDGLGSTPRSVSILGSDRADFTMTLTDGGLRLDLPSITPDPDATVIKLVFDGEPIIYHPVTIDADGEQFVGSTQVVLSSDTLARVPGASIRYTTDGSEPSAASPAYTGPVTLTQSANIAAAVFVGDRRVSESTLRSFTRADPWPAIVFVRAPDPGLKLETFSGDFQRCADFASASPDSDSISPTVSLPAENPPRERVARRYSGVISIPTTGMHHFALTSDDGSRLIIDDDVVIDNDGLHSAKELRGSAPLAAGYHRITIEWFNRTGGSALALKWRSSDAKWQSVPADMLAH